MNDLNLDKALKDPTNLSNAELDEVLEAQVNAMRIIKQLVPLDMSTENKMKTKKKRNQTQEFFKTSKSTHLINLLDQSIIYPFVHEELK